MRVGMGMYLALVVSFWQALSPAALAPDRFAPTFEAELRQLSDADHDSWRRTKDFDYIFVGGIIGEYLRPLGHFADMRRELVALGVPVTQTHLVFPSSMRTVEENARGPVRSTLERCAAQTPRKLVIVAHSKGGPELLSFALEHPEFVERHVEAVVFLQGAFGGSPLADILSGRAVPRCPMGRGTRLGMCLFGTIGRALHPWIRGVDSLTTEASRERGRRWLASCGDAICRIADKLLYVQTWVDPRRATARIRVAAHFIEGLGGVGDGALLLDAQRAGGIGRNAAILSDVDHSLPCSRILTWRTPRRARAFVRALAASVGR